jgi:small-conductance mechanosensitive channel
MDFQNLGITLRESFENVLNSVVDFLPKFLVAIVIVIIGWVVGIIVGKAIAQVVRALKIDNTLKGTEVEKTIHKGGFKLDIGMFVGGLVKWFLIVVFLISALRLLGLDEVNDFLSQVLAYIPNVVAAVLILLIAAVVGDVLQRIVRGSASAAGFRSAGLLGSVTRWAIWIFAILAALGQLHIAEPFVQTLFTGVIIALSLAFGLAFGLGGQEAAARYIEKMKDEISHREF